MVNSRDENASGSPSGEPSGRTWYGHLRDLWRSDPKGMSIDLLRVGVGLVWVLNLIFIVDPTNQFFPTFRGTVLSFAPTSLGGPVARRSPPSRLDRDLCDNRPLPDAVSWRDGMVRQAM